MLTNRIDRKHAASLLMISMIVVIDQFTKLWVVSFFRYHSDFMPITEFFNLVLVENKGISFGMFKNFAYGNHLFLLLSIILTLVIFKLLWMAKDCLSITSYSLIIGGAIGNIIDRVYNGAVIDFIELHLGHFYWPAFNVADAAICGGAFLLLYDLLKNDLLKKKIS